MFLELAMCKKEHLNNCTSRQAGLQGSAFLTSHPGSYLGISFRFPSPCPFQEDVCPQGNATRWIKGYSSIVYLIWSGFFLVLPLVNLSYYLHCFPDLKLSHLKSFGTDIQLISKISCHLTKPPLLFGFEV